MPNESLFSEQVTQPYLEFPIRTHDPHNDRVFKHITFPADEDYEHFRIQVINRNLESELIIAQKSITISLNESDKVAQAYRIKSVLSDQDHGVKESHWLSQKDAISSAVSSHNQYRMRGISTDGWKSDWIYSELKDMDNELIVYNMLYDIIDLIASVHDDQLDYMMDYIVKDTFIKLMSDQFPDSLSLLDIEEAKAAGVQEVLQMVSKSEEIKSSEVLLTKIGEGFLSLLDVMKTEFKENVFSGYQEFSDLYQMYRLLDQYRNKNTDLATLILEIFLEDRFEKLIQKTNIEVLLKNEEETGIYIKDAMEFDVKKELIDSVYHSSPNDGFVTKLNDAVQLLSEPIVYENLVYKKDEQVEKFLRLALVEIYAPIVSADTRLLELESELEDVHGDHIFSKLVEFAIINEGFEMRHMLLNDILRATIKGDLDLTVDYEAHIVDHLLNSLNDYNKSLLIDYHFDEMVDIFLEAGESFRYEYRKAFHENKESKQASLSEKMSSSNSYLKIPLREKFYSSLKSSEELSKIKSSTTLSDNSHVSFIDQAIALHTLFKESIEEQTKTHLRDSFVQDEVYSDLKWAESQQILSKDSFSVNEMIKYFQEKESVVLSQQEKHLLKLIHLNSKESEDIQVGLNFLYYNLFKHSLRSPNRFPMLDKYSVSIMPNLNDLFIMDVEDVVSYGLGSMDEDWTLGVFRLGRNTLKGEVSDS